LKFIVKELFHDTKYNTIVKDDDDLDNFYVIEKQSKEENEIK